MSTLVRHIFRSAIVICLLLSFPSIILAFGCEKWKSEIAGLGCNLASYISTYAKYTQKEISYSDFRSECDALCAKIKKIQSHAQEESSCSHSDGKYEKRRAVLLKTIDMALPTMTTGKYLAPAIKEALRKHEDDTD